MGGGGRIDISIIGGEGVATKGSIIAEVSLRDRTQPYQEVTARHLANA